MKLGRKDGGRRCGAGVLAGAVLLVCTWGSSGMFAASGQVQAPAPIERRLPPLPVPATNDSVQPPRYLSSNATAGQGGYVGQAGTPQRRPPQQGLPRGEHLAQWMSQHSNLTPEQQQQALGQESGFNALPPDKQQRYRERLTQLNALNPQQRQHRLAQIEAMERLSPEQRADVRGAMGQLGALPDEQRRAVARTFRALRDLSPEQRIPALDSGRFGPPLDLGQRTVLNELLRVEPMLPPPAPRQRAPAIQTVPAAPLYPGGQH